MEDELYLAGKKYVSSKRAASLSGYAKDYIGQLCRGNKLEAKLIGRNWYITIDSLTKIRKKHLIDELGAMKLASIASKPPAPNTSNLLDELDVAFFSDDTPLIPNIDKKESEQEAEVLIKKTYSPQEVKNESVESNVADIVPQFRAVEPTQPHKAESVREQAREHESHHKKSINVVSLIINGMVIASLITALCIPFIEVNISYKKTAEAVTSYTFKTDLASLVLSLRK